MSCRFCGNEEEHHCSRETEAASAAFEGIKAALLAGSGSKRKRPSALAPRRAPKVSLAQIAAAFEAAKGGES